METGAEWLPWQEPSTEWAMIGSQAGYEAYRDGTFELGDFVGTKHDPVRGDNVYKWSKPEALRVKGEQDPIPPEYPPVDFMTHDEQEALHRAEAQEHMYDPAHPERGNAWRAYKADADRDEGVGGYQDINGNLYAGREFTSGDHIRHESFDVYQTTRDEHLFRGQNARSERSFQRLDGQGLGAVHPDPAYVSTSYTRERAEWFAKYNPTDEQVLGEYLYEIDVPPGVPYAPIDPDPNGVVTDWGDIFPNEDELVLPAGTSLYQTGPLHVEDNEITIYPVVPLPPGYPPPYQGANPREYAMDSWAEWVAERGRGE